MQQSLLLISEETFLEAQLRRFLPSNSNSLQPPVPPVSEGGQPKVSPVNSWRVWPKPGGWPVFVAPMTAEDHPVEEPPSPSLAELQAQAVLTATVDAVIGIDSDYTITGFNPAAEALFGYPASQMLGVAIDILIPSGSGVLVNTVTATGIPGNTYRLLGPANPLQALRADGTTFVVEGTLCLSRTGTAAGYTLVLRNPSAPAEAAALLQRLGLELMRQQERLDQFDFITSHKIRGPVATMLGLLGLVDKSQLPGPDNLALFNYFEQSTQQLDQVIHELTQLLHMHLEADAVREQVSIPELFDEVLSGLQGTLAAAHVTVSRSDDPVPPLHCVRGYLRTVLFQLLSNAIKFRDPARRPAIHLSAGVDNGRFLIRVADNGLGINLVRNRNNVFNPYQRFHAHVDGKGLGLHLVRLLVETMGGTVAVDSEVDQGTTFTLSFQLIF